MGGCFDFSSLSLSLEIGVTQAFFHESGKWIISREVLKMKASELSIKELQALESN